MKKELSGLYSRNLIYKISEADAAGQSDYLQVTQALSRLMYQSIYIIDYSTMAFEYISDNPFFLCGYTDKEVMEMGYDFYLKNVPPEDLEMLNVINECGFDFFEGIPLQEKKEYSISYDFYLVDKFKKKVLVNHRLTPLFLTEDGKIWKSVCLVSLSGKKQSGNIVISRQGTDVTWGLDIAGRVWSKSLKPKLGSKEIEILQFYAQGMTIRQIAEKLHCSADTVKYYRKKIFESLEADNMPEALSYAINSKLI